MENVMCPNCGSSIHKSNFAYNEGKSYYECEDCGNTFSDDDIVYCDECGDQVIESERIDYNGMIFCSKDCVENHKKKTQKTCIIQK